MKFNLEVLSTCTTVSLPILNFFIQLGFNCAQVAHQMFIALTFVAANHVFKLLLGFFQVMFTGRTSRMKTSCSRI